MIKDLVEFNRALAKLLSEDVTRIARCARSSRTAATRAGSSSA
jgi:hypothetical protein